MFAINFFLRSLQSSYKSDPLDYAGGLSALFIELCGETNGFEQYRTLQIQDGSQDLRVCLFSYCEQIKKEVYERRILNSDTVVESNNTEAPSTIKKGLTFSGFSKRF